MTTEEDDSETHLEVSIGKDFAADLLGGNFLGGWEYQGRSIIIAKLSYCKNITIIYFKIHLYTHTLLMFVMLVSSYTCIVSDKITEKAQGEDQRACRCESAGGLLYADSVCDAHPSELSRQQHHHRGELSCDTYGKV